MDSVSHRLINSKSYKKQSKRHFLLSGGRRPWRRFTHLFSSDVCACSAAKTVLLFPTPWKADLRAPLSMGFSRQEYWSGLSCPPPGDLPNPGIKPRFLPHCRWILYQLSHQGSPLETICSKGILDFGTLGTVRTVSHLKR